MKTSVILSQLLTAAAAIFLALAPAITADHVIAVIFAAGLGCVLHADYSRRTQPYLADRAARTPREPLSLAA